MPYDELDTADLLVAIENGYRLHAAPDCNPQLYQLMQRCWLLEPHERPTFAEISVVLKDIAGSLPSGQQQKALSLNSKREMYNDYPSRYTDDASTIRSGARMVYENVELGAPPERGSISIRPRGK